MMKNEDHEKCMASNEYQVDDHLETNLYEMQRELSELVKQRDQINQEINQKKVQIQVNMKQTGNCNHIDLSRNKCDQKHLENNQDCTQSIICQFDGTLNSKTIELAKRLIYVVNNWDGHQHANDAIEALETYASLIESQFNEWNIFNYEQVEQYRVQSQPQSFSKYIVCPFYDELIHTRQKLNNEKKAFIDEILKMQQSCKEVKAASHDALLATTKKDLALLNLTFKANKAKFFVLFLRHYVKKRMHGIQDSDDRTYLQMRAWTIWRQQM